MDVLFAIRGLLSFVAFTESTTALRCLLPYSVSEEQAQCLFTEPHRDLAVERTLRHTYGLFSALVGIVIIHAAIFAHYRPIVNIALIVVSVKVLFLLAETFVFGSIASGQHLIFPLVTGFVTIAATLLLPFVTGDAVFSGGEKNDCDESSELAKQARRLRKTKRT